MRIAYLTIHVAPEIMRGGVGKKIRSQTAAWLGHEVAMFSLTPEKIPFESAYQYLFNVHGNIIAREISRYAALKKMIADLRQFRPDLIYLRYGLYSFPLHQIFKIAPVVVEINTNDVEEYITRGRFLYWLNRLTRGITLGLASGVVSPTHELIDILPSGYQGLVEVISNGMDLENSIPFPAPGNLQPEITMVASPGMNWHGVDKLIRLAGICPDLHVNIVGYGGSDVGNITISSNVILHGFLNHKDLLEVYKKTDVACGTLGLHRKNMEEACTLKVREALSYGLPLILGYRDTDLETLNLDTVLRIPNNESNVLDNFQEIRNFSYKMIGRRTDLNQIAPYMDQKRKEDVRLSFFEKVLRNTGYQ